MNVISFDEYAKALLMIKTMDTKSISPEFTKLFHSDKQLESFLDELNVAITDKLISPEFKERLVRLQSKDLMRNLAIQINDKGESFQPSIDEYLCFFNKGKPIDEYTFLKVVSFSIFMLCLCGNLKVIK